MQERDILDNNINFNIQLDDLLALLLPSQETLLKTWIKTLSYISPDHAAKTSMKLFFTVRKKDTRALSAFFENAKETQLIYNKKIVQVYRFGDSPKKILLIHGWAGRAADFETMIPALLHEGYEVVTFDGPAHGYSEGSKTNAIEFGDIIKMLHDRFGAFHKIMGHSFGGFVAARAIAIYPEITPAEIITISSPESLEKVVDSFAQFIGLSVKVTKKVKEMMQNRVGFSFDDMFTSKFLNQVAARKVIVHDLYDKQVNFNTAVEMHEKVPDAVLKQTVGYGHIRILKEQQVIEEILSNKF